MTEEEKKAIETKRHKIVLDKELYGEDSKNYKTDEIILNYIEKLQKENTELKEENEELKAELGYTHKYANFKE